MQKFIRNTISISLWIACSLSLTTAQTSDKTVVDYIDTYKDIAIQEMERSGIPASITLAQGIHESAYGNSLLAKKAKNHFGIKCTSKWKGKSYYKWDDDANKSCFRVYETALNSYVDHTDFLVNRKHYAFLFQYERTEYKKWAKGLRKAGYATDPKYPDKLIHTIEKYNLQQYDEATGILTFDPKITAEIEDTFNLSSSFKEKTRSFFFKDYKRGFFKKNGVSYAISKKEESALAVAKRFGIPYLMLLRFNDLEDGDILMNYQYIYIQPKRNIYKGSEVFHKVKMDETMYEIAQYYGIKLKVLLRINMMTKGEEPANNVIILLKDKVDKKPKLRPANHIDVMPPLATGTTIAKKKNTQKKISVPPIKRPKPAKVELNTPTYSEDVYIDTSRINTSKSKENIYLSSKDTLVRLPQKDVFNPYATSLPIKKEVKLIPVEAVVSPVNKNALFDQQNTTKTSFKEELSPYTSVKPLTEKPKIKNPVTTVVKTVTTLKTKFKIHTVQKGETLYSIFRKYGIPVQNIKSLNNLTSNAIKIGQKIKIP